MSGGSSFHRIPPASGQHNHELLAELGVTEQRSQSWKPTESSGARPDAREDLTLCSAVLVRQPSAACSSNVRSMRSNRAGPTHGGFVREDV